MSGRLSARQQKALIVAGILVGLAGHVYAFGLPLSSGGYDQSGSVSYNASSGPNATISGDINVQNGSAFPNSNTVVLNTTDGNISFVSASHTNVSIDSSNITGTWTNVTNLDVTGAELYIVPEDKAPINVSGDLDAIAFRQSYAIDDDQVDFVYSGQSGTNTVTIRGVPANRNIGAVNTSGTMLDASQSDGSGSVTFSGMQNSNHKVTLVTSDGAPELSNPSPQGEQNSTVTELSVDIDDPDFDTGDNVTVKFYLDGNLIDTQYIQSAQTVTTQIPASGKEIGVHDVNVSANDSYGQKRDLDWQYSLPGNVTIKEIEPPHDNVTNSEVELTFYDEDEVLGNLTTTTGEVNMSGIPLRDNYIVDVEADGYYSRTTILDTLTKNQTIYIRNNTRSAVNVTFGIDDKTGTFPAETTQILILEPLNDTTDSLQFVRIAGDVPGADVGYTATLVPETRYQIKLRNQDGDVRVLGSFVSGTSDETVTLKPSTLGVSLNASARGFDWRAYYNDTQAGQRISVEYVDPEDQTDEIKIYIHEQGNKSNQFVNTTINGPLGTAKYAQPLTQNQSNKTWVVHVYAERDGETKHLRAVVGQQTYEQAPMMPEWMQNAVAIVFVILIGGLFSVANVRTGAVVTSMGAAGFWFIGWLPSEAGGAITFALAVAIIYKIAGSRV